MITALAWFVSILAGFAFAILVAIVVTWIEVHRAWKRREALEAATNDLRTSMRELFAAMQRDGLVLSDEEIAERDRAYRASLQ